MTLLRTSILLVRRLLMRIEMSWRQASFQGSKRARALESPVEQAQHGPARSMTRLHGYDDSIHVRSLPGHCKNINDPYDTWYA